MAKRPDREVGWISDHEGLYQLQSGVQIPFSCRGWKGGVRILKFFKQDTDSLRFVT